MPERACSGVAGHLSTATTLGKSREVPCPTAHQVNLPACFLHCLFNTERQAGKLRIPILKSLVINFKDPTRNQTQVYSSRRCALTTRPSER